MSTCENCETVGDTGEVEYPDGYLKPCPACSDVATLIAAARLALGRSQDERELCGGYDGEVFRRLADVYERAYEGRLDPFDRDGD